MSITRSVFRDFGIFEVTVVALQHVLLVFAHQEESQLAYFATALVMAALFDPSKRRIDAFVDRLFSPEEDDLSETADRASACWRRPCAMNSVTTYCLCKSVGGT